LFIYAEGFTIERRVRRWYSAKGQEEEEGILVVIFQEERKVASIVCHLLTTNG